MNKIKIDYLLDEKDLAPILARFFGKCKREKEQGISKNGANSISFESIKTSAYAIVFAVISDEKLSLSLDIYRNIHGVNIYSDEFLFDKTSFKENSLKIAEIILDKTSNNNLLKKQKAEQKNEQEQTEQGEVSNEVKNKQGEVFSEVEKEPEPKNTKRVRSEEQKQYLKEITARREEKERARAARKAALKSEILAFLQGA